MNRFTEVCDLVGQLILKLIGPLSRLGEAKSPRGLNTCYPIKRFQLGAAGFQETERWWSRRGLNPSQRNHIPAS